MNNINCKTIQELYNGNITPYDIDIVHTPNLLELNKEITDTLNKLEQLLGPNNAIFEKYNELINTQYSEFQKIAFEDGFSLGIRLTFEALNNTKSK